MRTWDLFKNILCILFVFSSDSTRRKTPYIARIRMRIHSMKNAQKGYRQGDGKLDGFVKYRNTSIIFSIIVIAAVLLFVRGRMKQNIYVEARTDTFYLRSYSGEEAEISYSDLTGVEYATSLDLGTLIHGTDDKKARSGVWENERFGEYRLFALPKVTEYMVLKTADSVTVFNYEGTETTRGLYDAFKTLIQKKGLESQVQFTDAEQET